MANTLGDELTGKHVVLKKRYYRGVDPVERVFLCEGGFGCSSFTMGISISGIFIMDRERTLTSGFEVERFASPEEVNAARSKFFDANPQLELLWF